MPKATDSHIEAVAEALEHYARRGVFRGFSRGTVEKGRAHFRMIWHRDRTFDFVLDLDKHTMRFPVVLPKVPAKGPLALQDHGQGFQLKNIYIKELK